MHRLKLRNDGSVDTIGTFCHRPAANDAAVMVNLIAGCSSRATMGRQGQITGPVYDWQSATCYANVGDRSSGGRRRGGNQYQILVANNGACRKGDRPKRGRQNVPIGRRKGQDVVFARVQSAYSILPRRIGFCDIARIGCTAHLDMSAWHRLACVVGVHCPGDTALVDHHLHWHYHQSGAVARARIRVVAGDTQIGRVDASRQTRRVDGNCHRRIGAAGVGAAGRAKRKPAHIGWIIARCGRLGRHTLTGIFG